YLSDQIGVTNAVSFSGAICLAAAATSAFSLNRRGDTNFTALRQAKYPAKACDGSVPKWHMLTGVSQPEYAWPEGEIRLRRRILWPPIWRRNCARPSHFTTAAGLPRPSGCTRQS